MRPAGSGCRTATTTSRPIAKSVTIREQYVAYVAHLLVLGGDARPRQAEADAATVLRIETALAKASLTRVEQRDPHKIYHLMPLAELAALAPACEWPRTSTLQGVPARRKRSTCRSRPSSRPCRRSLTSEPVDDLRTYLRFHSARGRGAASLPIRSSRRTSTSSRTPCAASRPCRRAGRPARARSTATSARRSARSSSAAPSPPTRKAKTQRMTEQIETAMEREIEGARLDGPGDQGGRAAQAARHPQQDRLPRSSGATTPRSPSRPATTSATCAAR